MMKEIKVKCISNGSDEKSIDQVSEKLDSLERHSLDFVPWPSFPDKPKVSFSLAYDKENIFIKYFVTEKYLRERMGYIGGWVQVLVEKRFQTILMVTIIEPVAGQ